MGALVFSAGESADEPRDSDRHERYAGFMTRFAPGLRWSWNVYLLGLLVVAVALQLVPQGLVLILLDALAGGLLLAGLLRSAQVVFFWDQT